MADSWATQITSSSSSSSSSSHFAPQPKYDVFLSFSGFDTRKTFTDHLLAALERRGVYTFRDDTKLSRGEDIKTQLPKAIEESRISLVIFSKNYAASEWCLDELVKIMDCKKSFQQIVLPIFYDVDPSEVRGHKGSLADAFSEHQNCEKAEEWRKTLTEVANLSGWVLKNVASGHEAKFIQMIVEGVEKKLNFVPLHVADHPVGIEPRLHRVTKLLRMESDDARIVAIWGIGGIGKTTIAKSVYNLFHCQFEGCSFIANVRETSKMPNGLVLLQKHLVSDILGNENLNIGNFHQGIEVIKRRVFCHRLLLVLDDVDHVEQLKALAVDQKFLYPGSRIIITTRDISSLNSLKLRDGIYKPEGLNQYESLQLFSRHAFKENNPMVDYIKLSDEVVHYSSGVPLVLEVLGSSLFKKTKFEWRSAITELKKIPHDDVQKKLQISFDSLSERRKQLFLDIACFFVGMDRDFTIKILEGCDFHPVIGIRELADRGLINSYDLTYNKIVMHDVLRDMGKEIVRQESKEPGRRSRLWDSEDSLQVLRDGTGTEMVEGLFLNLLEPKHVQANAKDDDFFQNLPEAKDVEADAKAFEKMRRLRLLHLNFVHLTIGLEHISRRLVWLNWKGFPLTSVPSHLSLENLVTLDLSYSKLKKVWKKSKDNVSLLPNGISSLISLEILQFGAKNLLAFPNGICYLTGLEILLITDYNLSCLPNEIGCLISLKILLLRRSNLCTLPDIIGNLPQLEELELSDCKMLRSVPALPASLRSLNVDNCTSLESISMSANWLNQAGMSFHNCSKLAETYATKNFRERLLEYNGLSFLRNPVTLRFLGDVVPTWIEYQSMGSLSLVVPHLVNNKLLGLILWIAFTTNGSPCFPMIRFPKYHITNKFKGFGRVYQPEFWSYIVRGRDETLFSYVPLCYIEIQIEGQDEVEISVMEEEAYQLKKWGVTPIYEVDKNNIEANDGALVKYTSSLTYQHLAGGIAP